MIQKKYAHPEVKLDCGNILTIFMFQSETKVATNICRTIPTFDWIFFKFPSIGSENKTNKIRLIAFHDKSCNKTKNSFSICWKSERGVGSAVWIYVYFDGYGYFLCGTLSAWNITKGFEKQMFS